MELKPGEIICMYCRHRFTPEPVIRRQGKKKRTYIECPRCGNGFEREFRRYDAKPRKIVFTNV